MVTLKEYVAFRFMRVRSLIMNIVSYHKNAFGQVFSPTRQWMVWEVDQLVEKAQVDQTANMARQELVHTVIDQNAEINTSNDVAIELALISIVLFIALIVSLVF